MFFEAVVYLLLGLLGYGVWNSFRRGEISSDVPPGGTGWPLLGDTLEFLEPHKSNSMAKFLQERCSRYGRVFKSHVLGLPTIVSCDVELNFFILQNEGTLFCSNYPRHMRNIVGESSMTFMHGELHKRLRVAYYQFTNISKASPNFLSHVEKMSISMMEPWRKERRREVHFYTEVKKFTNNLMLKHLLGIDAGDTKSPRILEDLNKIVKGIASFPIYLPGTSYAKAMKARARLMSTIRGIITERQKKEIACRCTEESKNIIEEICVKGQFNDEEKVSIVFGLLLGGYENPSGLIALIVYFLSHSPDSLQKLKEEHESLRRNKKDGEALSLDEYKQMVFTSKVINEALRCGNVATIVLRKALKDVKYKNFVIPSGWQVIPIISATHLDSSVHKNPSEFVPSRWDDESTSRKVIPFGGGIRLCPGAELVRIQTAFFLHHFVTRFRWEVKADECPLSHPFVQFKRGLLLVIEPLTSG